MIPRFKYISMALRCSARVGGGGEQLTVAEPWEAQGSTPCQLLTYSIQHAYGLIIPRVPSILSRSTAAEVTADKSTPYEARVQLIPYALRLCKRCTMLSYLLVRVLAASDDLSCKRALIKSLSTETTSIPTGASILA
jgi:hypothetical protein